MTVDPPRRNGRSRHRAGRSRPGGPPSALEPDRAAPTFAEELVLLLHDEDGAPLPVQKDAFECALAGAVLMDLAFAGRIDTDLRALMVIDRAPTGNPVLDRILAKIAARGKRRTPGPGSGNCPSTRRPPFASGP